MNAIESPPRLLEEMENRPLAHSLLSLKSVNEEATPEDALLALPGYKPKRASPRANGECLKTGKWKFSRQKSYRDSLKF